MSIPTRIFRSVVFPAPFGPRIPSISCFPNVRDVPQNNLSLNVPEGEVIDPYDFPYLHALPALLSNTIRRDAPVLRV